MVERFLALLLIITSPSYLNILGHAFNLDHQAQYEYSYLNASTALGTQVYPKVWYQYFIILEQRVVLQRYLECTINVSFYWNTFSRTHVS
jgi:hypothetical protein